MEDAETKVRQLERKLFEIKNALPGLMGKSQRDLHSRRLLREKIDEALRLLYVAQVEMLKEGYEIATFNHDIHDDDDWSRADKELKKKAEEIEEHARKHAPPA